MAVVCVLATASAAWAFGELSQTSGRAGCVSERRADEGCRKGRALGDAADLAISPDGRNAYVTSFGADSVAVLGRFR